MNITVYTVSEAAEILRVSSKTIYRLISDGTIECVRVRGSIRITRRALDEFLEQGGKQQYDK